MTYEKLVEKVAKAYAKADASKFKGHVAVQVNVIGEAHGAFYIEILDGKMNVQPYDYYDHDMIIECDEKPITDIASGKLKVSDAVKASKINVSGPNYDYAIASLDSVSFPEKKETKKTTKATVKKSTKTAAKKEDTKEVKAETEVKDKAPATKAVKATATKAAATKATATKTAVTKTTAKSTTKTASKTKTSTKATK